MSIHDSIAKQDFRFAYTMSNMPHFHVSRDRWVGDDFDDAVMIMREKGLERKWGDRSYIYYNSGDFEHWTMGAPLEETVIINRAYIGPWVTTGYDERIPSVSYLQDVKPPVWFRGDRDNPYKVLPASQWKTTPEHIVYEAIRGMRSDRSFMRACMSALETDSVTPSVVYAAYMAFMLGVLPDSRPKSICSGLHLAVPDDEKKLFGDALSILGKIAGEFTKRYRVTPYYQ